jgi:Flp pilus assembly protein TadD
MRMSFSLDRHARGLAHVGLGLFLGSYALSATAADPEWLRLQAPRFGVISQLNEGDTRRWAVEFDQFIDALHQLYAVDELALPPLTMVLFKNPRDFEPYHIRTDSGQADIAGFFASMGAWSVIGLTGRLGSSDRTRHVIYHEAVHWFTSASEEEAPLWFQEGLAEVYSTFEVVGGKGRWGMAAQENVDYLGYYGLMPIEELLRASQDQTLHGMDRYYPQAWAFVHYLMFGNLGAERPKLQAFLDQESKTSLDTAFTNAFGQSYEEVTNELRKYLDRGRYGIQEMEVRDRGEEMTIAPASPGNVEASLARLAVAGGNDEPARRHAEALLAIAPNNVVSYEIFAIVADRAGDTAALTAAVDKAIELGSRDPNIYSVKATHLMEATRRPDAPVDEMLPPNVARTAADQLGRALALRPRNRDTIEQMMFALLNVDTVSDQDDAVLATSGRALPTEGRVLVAQAAVARARGDMSGATELLRRARVEPFVLPPRQRSMVGALHDSWFMEWTFAELETFGPEHPDDAVAFLDAQLANDAIAGRVRTALEGLRADMVGFARLRTAIEARLDGRGAEADAILAELTNDPNISARLRREVERMAATRGEENR